MYQCKANGMVRDVFTQDAIARLIGGMGIGHGEYFFLHPPLSSFHIFSAGLQYPSLHGHARARGRVGCY